MKTQLAILIFAISASCVAEMAVLGEPLKVNYKLDGIGYSDFYQTGEFVDAFSIVCDMGQAIPNIKKEGWYENKPIKGLRLELRARAAFRNFEGDLKAMGFVVVVKGSDTLVIFKPLGDMIEGKWDGDVFNSWPIEKTDIEVHSERNGDSGYAYFDLISGNGFYFKWKGRSEPDYFLSKCRRIKKTGLPVYDWKLDQKVFGD